LLYEDLSTHFNKTWDVLGEI